MKPILLLLLVCTVAACNPVPEKKEAMATDRAVSSVQADTTASYIHTFADTALEDKITAALMKLPFVIKSDRYIDSFSNHKHGIAFLLEEPQAPETDIPVQAGYNGDQRFETYYRFFVNPKTLQIQVYNAIEDKKMSLKAYLKTQP
jgi:hypothetical protein